MYWLTADEIAEKDPELAIISIGSIEQHSHHLPVMTDWALAMEMGRRVAEKMNAFCLPALPISNCREHMGKKGSVWMEPLTFYHMLEDIVMSLKTQGFKKVGIILCHGGVFILTPFIRDMNAKHNPDLMVALAELDADTTLREQGVLEDPEIEIHSGECETSEMLAIAPETVHMDRAVDFTPDGKRSYLNYGSIFRLSPHGVWGKPSLATKEKGEIILETETNSIISQLNQAFAYMEAKEPFGYSKF